MGFPVIAYRTNLRNAGAVLAATSTDVGFTVQDVKDFRSFKLWKAGTVTSPQDVDLDLGASGAAAADYVALVACNLKALGATLEVLADSTTPPTTQRLAPFTPDGDDVEYRSFASPGALRYWRFRIAKGGGFASKPFVGEIMCGLKTVMPEFLGDGIDPFMEAVEAESEDGEGGHYLGSSLRGRSHRGELAFGGDGGLARAFLTSDLNAFASHANRRLPYVFVRDPDDADFKAPLYLRLPAGRRVERLPVGGVWSRLTFVVPFQEALMEAAA